MLPPLFVFAFFILAWPTLALAQSANPAKAAPSAAQAVSMLELEAVTVLALSQADGRAVLALPGQRMIVAKSGDPVPRTRAVLQQVMADKAVLEERSVDGKSRQMVWLHKGQAGKPGRIERFATAVAPVLQGPTPLSTTVTLPPAAPAARSKP